MAVFVTMLLVATLSYFYIFDGPFIHDDSMDMPAIRTGTTLDAQEKQDAFFDACKMLVMDYDKFPELKDIIFENEFYRLFFNTPPPSVNLYVCSAIIDRNKDNLKIIYEYLDVAKLDFFKQWPWSKNADIAVFQKRAYWMLNACKIIRLAWMADMQQGKEDAAIDKIMLVQMIAKGGAYAAGRVPNDVYIGIISEFLIFDFICSNLLVDDKHNKLIQDIGVRLGKNIKKEAYIESIKNDYNFYDNYFILDTPRIKTMFFKKNNTRSIFLSLQKSAILGIETNNFSEYRNKVMALKKTRQSMFFFMHPNKYGIEYLIDYLCRPYERMCEAVDDVEKLRAELLRANQNTST